MNTRKKELPHFESLYLSIDEKKKKPHVSSEQYRLYRQTVSFEKNRRIINDFNLNLGPRQHPGNR